MSTESTSVGGRREVVVVGGGVIGLSSAYHLLEAGYDVTLLERDECGQAASWGNAGWIVPSLVQPFNSSAMVKGALRAMTRRGSGVAIRQLPTLQFARWVLSFLAASSTPRSRASLEALSELAQGAARDVVDLAERLGFEIHRTGLLVPFRTDADLEAYEAGHREVEQLGYEGRVEVLDAAGAHRREPSLGDAVTGALHLRDEVSVRPDAMTSALRAAIVERGGELHEHTEVRAVRPDGAGKWQLATRRGILTAGAVVVASGETTAAVVRTSGAKMALQSGRGSSVTLSANALSLEQPLKIAEHRVACTPFANGEVRISGTFDLVKPGTRTDHRRMRGVLADAATYLPALEALDVDSLAVWSGARPCTTDSVPIVGPVGSVPGLIAATGHGTLGMTLAVHTGRSVVHHVGRALEGAR